MVQVLLIIGMMVKYFSVNHISISSVTFSLFDERFSAVTQSIALNSQNTDHP